MTAAGVPAHKFVCFVLLLVFSNHGIFLSFLLFYFIIIIILIIFIIILSPGQTISGDRRGHRGHDEVDGRQRRR
jgi:hypothetical protein